MNARELVAEAQQTRFDEESATHRAEIQLYGVYEISKLLAQPARLEITLARVVQLLSSFLDMRHGLIALLSDSSAPEIVVGSS
jgi:Nif-specific regulatory protein